MKKCQLYLSRSAIKELCKLHPVVHERIIKAISRLADDPRSPGVKKLKAGKGWSLRVGDYRIVHDIDDEELEVLVARARHRMEAYRGL